MPPHSKALRSNTGSRHFHVWVKSMRTLSALFALIFVLTTEGSAQTSSGNAPDATQNATGQQWELYASAYTYAVPHSHVYVNPNIAADRSRLHLEARYNYEAHQAGSLWVGANFEVGSKLVLKVSPMVGGVFGKLNGIAPGYLLSLSFGRFSVSSQAEYVFDLSDRSGNFFYTWSEFAYAIAEWFRAGIAIQRTKIYQTDLDIQRGLFAGFSWKRVDVTVYALNFGWTDPTIIGAVGVKF